MVMKLWSGVWEEQLKRTNKKVYEDNGRGGTQDKVQFWKLQKFSRNK